MANPSQVAGSTLELDLQYAPETHDPPQDNVCRLLPETLEVLEQLEKQDPAQLLETVQPK